MRPLWPPPPPPPPSPGGCPGPGRVRGCGEKFGICSSQSQLLGAGGQGPPSASSGPGRTTLLVTAPSGPGLPPAALARRREAHGRPGTSRGALLRSHPPPPWFFKRILSPPRLPSTTVPCSAPNGFCFVFYDFPPTNHLSDQFYLLPPPSFPLSPPPFRKPHSLRLDILQTIYVVFRIVIFLFSRPPPPMATPLDVFFCPSPA